VRVVERCLVGAVSDVDCADVLIRAPDLVGVADGATGKPWDPPGSPDGRTLALTVAEVLAGPRRGSAADAVAACTETIAALFAAAGLAPGSGSAATVAVLDARSRQVWRVGDVSVLIDGERFPTRPNGERMVAAARALVLTERLAAGANVDELLADDPGRATVQPLLRALVGLRNRDVPGYGYGAIDGTPVPAGLLEVIELPAGPCEVVLASDGYPYPAATLAESERLLRERLAADPLMITDPPATKGWAKGRNSFDDRAYVRARLPAG
jgi:hypothetical protein